MDAKFTMSLDDHGFGPITPSRVIGPDTFNLPQTLGLSRDRIGYNLNSLEPAPTDQFSPIAVITDFTVKYDIALGTGTTAVGTLSMMFPDKTKLTGIDQLLLGRRASSRSQSSLGGWRHPRPSLLGPEAWSIPCSST